MWRTDRDTKFGTCLIPSKLCLPTQSSMSKSNTLRTPKTVHLCAKTQRNLATHVGCHTEQILARRPRKPQHSRQQTTLRSTRPNRWLRPLRFETFKVSL